MRALFLLLVLSTAAVSMASPSTVAAQDNNPLVEEGESLYDELRFEEALQTLSAAYVRSGNSNASRARILRTLAFTYLALGREAEAAGAYRSMLAIEPEFVPGSDVSPRFRAFFANVRQSWEQEGRPGSAPPAPVSIQHVSPPQADPGDSVELRAALEGATERIASVVLAYRQGTSDVYQRLDTTFVEGEYIATIPGDDVSPPLVEYYFEGLDAGGLPVAARGDVAAPLRIAVEGEGSGSIFRKWWFWTAAVVVIGGAVTAAVLLTRDNGPANQGMLIVNIGE